MVITLKLKKKKKKAVYECIIYVIFSPKVITPQIITTLRQFYSCLDAKVSLLQVIAM